MLTRAGQQYGYVGHPVDVWSAGVTLFAMLCGFLPFEHASTSSLYKKIIAGSAATDARAHTPRHPSARPSPTRPRGDAQASTSRHLSSRGTRARRNSRPCCPATGVCDRTRRPSMRVTSQVQQHGWFSSCRDADACVTSHGAVAKLAAETVADQARGAADSTRPPPARRTP
eukprot:2895676-Prymnesium_polylepis.1